MTTANETGTRRCTAEGLVAASKRNGEPDFLLERRRIAFDTWNRLPLPDRGDDVWRRVKLDAARIADALERPAGAPLLSLSGVQAPGVFWGEVSRAIAENPGLLREHWATTVYPAGDSGRAARRGGKFHALNQAFFDSGYVLHVAEGQKVAEPFCARFAAPGSEGASLPHNLVVLEAGTEATLVEHYSAIGNGLCQPQTEAILRPGAKLNYVLLQRDGTETTHLAAHRVRLMKDARVNLFSAHLGAALSKTFLDVELAEPGAEALVRGLYFGRGGQKTHIDTWQHHVAPNCKSDLLIKGVLDGSAYGVYRGMIRLEEGAQKTDAYQQNRTLLLTDDACMHSIPGLEINADDVRCTHGATVGQLDPEMLFYLRSRGLSLGQARHAILEGFFEEVLVQSGVPDVTRILRDELHRLIGGDEHGG